MESVNNLLKYLSRNKYSLPRKQFSLPWLLTFLATAGTMFWVVFVQGFAIQSFIWPRTTCTVTSYAYDTVVQNGYTCEYNVEGITHTILTHGTTKHNPSDENLGQNHIVFYDPAKPGDGRSPETNLAGYYALMLLAIFGAIAICIGSISAWRKNVIRTRTIDRLRRSGQALDAIVTNTSVRYVSKGKTMTTIFVQAKSDLGKTANKYASDKVWSDYPWLQPGLPARVFINPNNPNEYYVDIDFWEQYFATDQNR